LLHGCDGELVQLVRLGGDDDLVVHGGRRLRRLCRRFSKVENYGPQPRIDLRECYEGAIQTLTLDAVEFVLIDTVPKVLRRWMFDEKNFADAALLPQVVHDGAQPSGRV
jgi:hypothetical protein